MPVGMAGLPPTLPAPPKEVKQSFDLSRSELEKLIDEWIFREKDRAILKRRLLDGITYETLAEA